MPTLKTRTEFLAVRGGRRASTPSFLVEMRTRARSESPAAGPRFGFTITKKIGNAVTRNRIRRRLKAAFAACTKCEAQEAFDYVVVARGTALDRPFALLLKDVTQALAKLHGPPGERSTGMERGARRASADKKGSA